MSTNRDLLKQAIAEAKTIREAAIANAKEALEETLTPHLKDMLALKLQEMEEKDEEYMEETLYEAEEEETEAEEELEPGHEEEETPEEEEAEGEEEVEIEDMSVEELKDLIRDIVAQEVGNEEVEDYTPETEPEEVGAEEGEEEINIDELLAELTEMESNQETPEHEAGESAEFEAGEQEEEKEARMKAEADLAEALKTVETLRTQLQEVNLLNAKLLYVNKVFKSNNLTEGQKVNVIAAFDKAETVREVKLVFETVSKNVTTKKPVTIKEHVSFASKPTGTSATNTEIINEVSSQVLRMQKLAGIIK